MNAAFRPPSAAMPSAVEHWYDHATVRKSPRIIVPPSTAGEYIFPRSRQCLADHPRVVSLGDNAVAFVLAQSAYKYMYEIGLLETRFVIDCGLNIVNNVVRGADDAEKREALAIVIDEGYHAYVALDFIIQMKERNGIAPICVPDMNGNLDAVERAFALLPPEMHHDFQLVSVCLAEHTLTKDLLSIGREKDATRAFTQVMTDHVSDEGRHAGYFARLTTAHWQRMPEATRVAIGQMLPHYLDDYLAGDTERTFDRAVLHALAVDDSDACQIIADTNAAGMDSMETYITTTKAKLVKLLQRTGILQHDAARAAFIAHGVAF